MDSARESVTNVIAREYIIVCFFPRDLFALFSNGRVTVAVLQSLPRLLLFLLWRWSSADTTARQTRETISVSLCQVQSLQRQRTRVLTRYIGETAGRYSTV